MLFIVLRLCRRPGEAWLRARGSLSAPKGCLQGAASPLPWLGFLLHGISTFTWWLPLVFTFLRGSPLALAYGSLATAPSLPHLACLARRGGQQGIMGTLGLCKALFIRLGGEREGCLPPRYLPPKATGHLVGSFLAAPLASSASGSSLGPHPGQAWLEAWPSGLCPETASASPGLSLLCAGPLPPACCLEGPSGFLISTSASSPAQAHGSRRQSLSSDRPCLHRF